VINLPTTALTDEVVDIGTCSGAGIDKFERFGLTTESADTVAAPCIRECFACFECRLVDTSLMRKYNFFIWEVVAARAAATPRHPETLHYTGAGTFVVAGRIIHRRRAALL